MIATRSSGREERLLVGVHQHGDDDAVEQPQRPADDVDVPVRDRIERAGKDGECGAGVGRSSMVIPSSRRRTPARCHPTPAAARGATPAASGAGRRAACSSTQIPPAAQQPDSQRDRRGEIRLVVGRIEEDDVVDGLEPAQDVLRRPALDSIAVPVHHPQSRPRMLVISSRIEPGSRRSAARARASRSTKVTCAAPRLSASMPTAPVPAKTSSTRAPASRPCSTLNSVSRSLSDVGRRPGQVGASRRRPFSVPAMMRRRPPSTEWTGGTAARPPAAAPPGRGGAAARGGGGRARAHVAGARRAPRLPR